MKTESFTKYRLIDWKTGNIIYEVMLNNIINHEEKLEKELSRISDEKNFPI